MVREGTSVHYLQNNNKGNKVTYLFQSDKECKA